MAAPTEVATGDQAATIGVEHTLSTPADAGTYFLVVDLSNMALGDVVTLRIYVMESTSGTLREAWSQRYSHVNNRVSVSPPIPSIRANGISFRLEQEVGTGRTFPWTVGEYA